MPLTEAQTQQITSQYYNTDPTLIRRYASLTGTPGVVTGRLGAPPPPRATAAPTAATPAGPEFTDVSSFAKWTGQQYQNLLKSQQQQQESLFGRFTAASQAQEPLTSAYTRLGAEAGIPETEKTIMGYKTQMATLQNQLSGLEQNILERTRGQDVSEAQRQRLQVSEQGGLTRQLGELGTAMTPYTEQLSSSQQKIATQLGLMDRDQQKALQPLIMQIDQISGRFAREITMYTSQKETELSALLDKIERQRQLDDREWQQAQQLASEEREWSRTKEQIAIDQANKIKLLGYEGSSSSAKAADKTVNKIDKMIQQAMWSGQYTAAGEQGKSSREQLIKDIYGDVDADYRVIADRVYRQFRGGTEAAYGGLPADWRM